MLTSTPAKLSDDVMNSRRGAGRAKTDAELTAFVEQCKGDPESWFIFSAHVSQSGASNRASRLKASPRYGKLPLRWKSHTSTPAELAEGQAPAIVAAQYAIEKDSNPGGEELPAPWMVDEGKVWYVVEDAPAPFAVTIVERSDGSLTIVDGEGQVRG